MTIDILPTTELQVFSNMPAQKIELYHGSTLSMPIQFSGTINGTYSLAIEAVYDSLDGQQSRRVLSVPIVIGPKPAAKSQPANPQQTKSKTGLIVLPAQEVIR